MFGKKLIDCWYVLGKSALFFPPWQIGDKRFDWFVVLLRGKGCVEDQNGLSEFTEVELWIKECEFGLELGQFLGRQVWGSWQSGRNVEHVGLFFPHPSKSENLNKYTHQYLYAA